MTKRSKMYYATRSVVRALVATLLTAFAFFGVHLAAASFWSAIATAASLWAIYFLLVVRDSRRSTLAFVADPR